jgi:DNA-binding response OmpR family regulator
MASGFAMDGTVLLVHDAQAVRASARKALTEAGHDVAEAVDLPTAVQVAGRARPSLIFLPWLGRRAVREALGELRAGDATRRSRVIVWAEQGEIGDAALALELGDHSGRV